MQYLPFVLALVVGSVVVGVSAVFFLRARFRETIEQSAGSPVAEEVKAIGTQIASALSEQRVQGETQRQLLAQKLDSVRQSVDAQRSHVDGLRSEMRHEVSRRDAEMDEIRSQIGSIRAAVSLGPAVQAALPPAPQETAPVAEVVPPRNEPSVRPSDPSREAAGRDEPAPPTRSEPTDSEPTESEPAESADAPAPPSLATPQIPPVMVPEPSGAAEDPFGAFTFGDSVSMSPDAGAPPAAFEAWAPTPGVPSESETVAPSPVEPTAPEPTHAPAGAVFEDVTFGDATFSEVAPPTPATSAPSPAPLAEPVDAEVARPEAPRVEPPRVEAPAADDRAPEREGTPTPAPRPETPGTAEPPRLVTFEDVSFGSVSAPVPPASAPSEPEPFRAPSFDPSWIARPAPPHDSAVEDASPFSADDLFSTPPFADESTQGLIDLGETEPVAPAAAPFVAPEGADDLTVISSIDDDVQRRLYIEGVTRLEDIAQWNRTRARQVAVAVQVSEETIMNQWVFEAQAAMFNQFASQNGA